MSIRPIRGSSRTSESYSARRAHGDSASCEHPAIDPSSWITRWGTLVAPGGRVLDVATGKGRHTRWFAARGHPVDAVDRDAEAIAQLAGVPGIHAVCADIEGGDWPFARGSYAGVCVTHYLHRPLFPTLLDALAPGGVLIYETFARGNERYGRPSNPDFLLNAGELLDEVRGRLRVIAYEDIVVEDPRPACIQRICATS
jgi:SAM-dependent methyltransferase